jgi:hypothetical protein
MRENNAKVFLDSGAFSEWTTGANIKITDYCDYILRNHDILRVEDGAIMASVLDAIGSAQGTFENQMAMEKLGVRPLPCFHKYEDPRYLEWYIKNYEYITIGGMVGSSPKALIQWLDEIWEKYLLDGAGNPRLKVHAFGVTSVQLMERYPWHSCDSSSWIQVARFGNVYSPDYGVMSVSDESPSKHVAGAHFSNLPELQAKAFEAKIKSKGFEIERLALAYEARAAYNVNEFMDLNDKINAANLNTFKHRNMSLF